MEQFIRNRQYLTNVSPRTVQWYREALSKLPNESPTKQELDVMVIEMQQRGCKATTVNCWARAMNCFLFRNKNGKPLPRDLVTSDLQAAYEKISLLK